MVSIILLLILLVESSKAFEWHTKKPEPARSPNCYRTTTEHKNLLPLEDVLDSDRLPRDDKTIFFHITNCLEDGYAKLSSRQACAVESAAKNNPSLDVFVLFSSPVTISSNKSNAIEALLSYENVFLRNNNLWKYTEGTPAEKWFQSEVIFTSNYMYSHLSDLARYTSLWRFGGIYMDVDVVVVKSLEEVPLNFAGAENLKFVASGIMGLERHGLGHQVADECLKLLVAEFDGQGWNSNGPMIITNVLKRKICKEEQTHLMTPSRCSRFMVYPPQTFYAIPFKDWPYFFKDMYLSYCIHRTKDSLLVHLWNKASSSMPLKVGKHTCYGAYAGMHCPKAYYSSGELF